MNIIDMRPVRTPFMSLNRMLGPLEGFKRGDFILINSLPGEYDRELADDILIGTILSNSPRLLDEYKTPIVAKITCNPGCDESTSSLLTRASTGLGDTISNIAEIMVTASINIRNVMMSPDAYSMALIYEKFAMWTEDGFEVTLIVINDLHKLREVTSGNLSLREVYASLREYFKELNVTFVSAFPLSEEVETIRAKNPEEYLAIASDHDLLAHGASRLTQEADMQILIGLNKSPSDKPDNLTMYIGKQRGAVTTGTEAKYQYDRPGHLPYTHVLAQFTNIHPITVDDMSHAKSNLSQTPISGQVDRIVFYALEDIGNIMKTQINETLNDNELSFRVTSVKYKYNDRCYATINGIESRIDIDVTAEDGEVKGFNFTASTKLMDDNPVTLYVEDKSYDLRHAFHRLALAYHLLHEVNHGDVAALSFD